MSTLNGIAASLYSTRRQRALTHPFLVVDGVSNEGNLGLGEGGVGGCGWYIGGGGGIGGCGQYAILGGCLMRRIWMEQCWGKGEEEVEGEGLRDLEPGVGASLVLGAVLGLVPEVGTEEGR